MHTNIFMCYNTDTYTDMYYKNIYMYLCICMYLYNISNASTIWFQYALLLIITHYWIIASTAIILFNWQFNWKLENTVLLMRSCCWPLYFSLNSPFISFTYFFLLGVTFCWLIHIVPCLARKSVHHLSYMWQIPLEFFIYLQTLVCSGIKQSPGREGILNNSSVTIKQIAYFQLWCAVTKYYSCLKRQCHLC